MKKIFAVLGLFFAVTAFATEPKVGDTATYDLHSSHLQGQTGTLVWGLLTADRATNTSTLSQNLSIMGHNQVKTVKNTFEALLAAEKILPVCADHGTSEGIDVPAGHFDTCRIVQETAAAVTTIWFGDVPVLGFVKYQQVSKRDNSTTEFDLRSFSRASR